MNVMCSDCIPTLILFGSGHVTYSCVPFKSGMWSVIPTKIMVWIADVNPKPELLMFGCSVGSRPKSTPTISSAFREPSRIEWWILVVGVWGNMIRSYIYIYINIIWMNLIYGWNYSGWDAIQWLQSSVSQILVWKSIQNLLVPLETVASLQEVCKAFSLNLVEGSVPSNLSTLARSTGSRCWCLCNSW